jgi:hypothetical protein
MLDSVLNEGRLAGQVCAIVSLLTGKCVPPTTAMTGEVRYPNNAYGKPLTGDQSDHAPRTRLARRWDQRKSAGRASRGGQQGDTPVGEQEGRRARRAEGRARTHTVRFCEDRARGA